MAIADGDTLTARCGEEGAFQQVKVRLAEIDAPEKAQPFGNRSRQHLAELCFQQVAMIRQTSRDRYGRAVARVECQGKDANLEQVRAGMAWAYDRYLTDPEVKAREAAARSAGVGLWGEPDPLPPWEWRRKR